MASILKVDEMQGVTSAGDITVTSEGGSATQSLQQGLAKTWVNFNGDSTVAIIDSLNTSGITDNGTGDYTITINNDMGSADYCFTYGIKSEGSQGANFLSMLNGDTPTAGTITVQAYAHNAVTVDSPRLNIAIHGDLA